MLQAQQSKFFKFSGTVYHNNRHDLIEIPVNCDETPPQRVTLKIDVFYTMPGSHHMAVLPSTATFTMHHVNSMRALPVQGWLGFTVGN